MKRFVAAVALLLATAAHAEDGAALFQAKCKMCHGADGKGSAVGKSMGAKDLTALTITAADAARVVENGKGKMMPFKGKLSGAEIEAVAAFAAGLRK